MPRPEQPKLVEGLFGKAKFYLNRYNFSHSLDVLNQAVAAYQGFLPALLEKMKVQLALQDWEQAVETAHRWGERGGEERGEEGGGGGGGGRREGRRGEEEGEREENKTRPWDFKVLPLHRCLGEDVNCIEAVRMLTLDLLAREGKYDEAADKIGELIQLIDRFEPNNHALYFDMSLAFARMVSIILCDWVSQNPA